GARGALRVVRSLREGIGGVLRVERAERDLRPHGVRGCRRCLSRRIVTRVDEILDDAKYGEQQEHAGDQQRQPVRRAVRNGRRWRDRRLAAFLVGGQRRARRRGPLATVFAGLLLQVLVGRGNLSRNVVLRLAAEGAARG